jgi:hypothetical protein
MRGKAGVRICHSPDWIARHHNTAPASWWPTNH